MVKYSNSLDKVFAALSDGTRRAILARLSETDAEVSELARDFPISLPAVSKHLAVLEKAGLVQRHKHGRVRRCELQAAPLQQANDWLEQYRGFWEGRLDALQHYLQTTQKQTQDKEKKK